MTESLEGLRKFHNWIKLQLIIDARRTTNGTKLLDVAVGRGGDIIKWSKAKIKYVTGFDSDSKSIYEKTNFDGAIKRYNSVKSQINMPRCFFWNISATDPFILNLLNGKDRNCIYDIVSCQFSFHYFVNDIDIVLNMISQKLRNGGLFIGTATDGDIIKHKLQEGNGNVNNEALEIKTSTDNMYSFELKSCKTSRETYFEYKGASYEYYLFKEFFINKCLQHNLHVMHIQNFQEWYTGYNYKNLTENEKMCSFLNFSFIFKKI